MIKKNERHEACSIFSINSGKKTGEFVSTYVYVLNHHLTMYRDVNCKPLLERILTHTYVNICTNILQNTNTRI